MAKQTAPVMTTSVEECAQPKSPAIRVTCHCPRECWANTATLELMERDGYAPDFYCLECAPEPMRSSARFIIENRKALGIEEGTPLMIEVEEHKPTIQWPHGGNLN